ncbi:MAG: protein kinase [Myxococcota bacterium]
MPSDTVGPYLLEQHLARGGMGDVWRARRMGMGGFSRVVALKRIHPGLVDSTGQVEQFLREARLGSWLSHPNAVGVLDVGVHEGRPFLVMEFVDGVDLRRVFSRGETLGMPIPPELAAYVIHQSLCALEAAHALVGPDGAAASLVHRDVSPENILVGRHGEVRVADFGLARQLARDEGLTQAGMIKGKLAYMSPEQLLSHPLDDRSDLYSVAVTFYEILCGQRPYEAPNPLLALERAREPSPHPSDVRPAVPRALGDLAQQWRHPWPDERAASLHHARRALEQVLVDMLHGAPNTQLAAFVAGLTTTPQPEGRMPTQPSGSARRQGRCTKCHGLLAPELTQGSVILDRCVDCRGVWLDAHELARILGARHQMVLDATPAATPHPGETLDSVVGDCPRCAVRLQPGVVRGMPHFHVEKCGRCQGMWFDAGELEQLAHGDVAAFVRAAGGLE